MSAAKKSSTASSLLTEVEEMIAAGDPMTPLESQLWRKLFSTLEEIKNRLAHMERHEGDFK